MSSLSAAAAVGLFLSAGWMALSAQTASAQGPQMRPMTFVLVDVNYIFKNHEVLKGKKAELLHIGEAYQQQYKTELEAINKRAEDSRTYTTGTTEYKQIEEEVVTRKAKLQVWMNDRKNEMVQRESKLYYEVYTEVSQAVTAYCSHYGISMALSFNREAIDPSKPDDVLRGINSKVVYYLPELDISPLILNQVSPRPAHTADTGGFVYPQPPRQ